MQHLGPRRAHPRALAGGENDCQTCAASAIPALRRGSIHDNSFSAASGPRRGRRPHDLYLKNAKFGWQIAARKSELVVHPRAAAWERVPMGGRTFNLS